MVRILDLASQADCLFEDLCCKPWLIRHINGILEMYHDTHNYCNFGMQFEPNYDAISFHAPNLLSLKKLLTLIRESWKNPKLGTVTERSKLRKCPRFRQHQIGRKRNSSELPV